MRSEAAFTRMNVAGVATATQVEIIHETPTLYLTDITTGDDDWRIYSDADNFHIQQKVGDAAWTDRFVYTSATTTWEATGNFTITGTTTLDTLTGILTASSGVVSVHPTVDTTELGQLNGCTENIQNHFDDTSNPHEVTVTQVAAQGGVLPIANGGTNSSTALSNNRVIVSSAGSIVESATISSTELGYLNGVNDNIQDQLDERFETENLKVDLDFTASSSESATINLSQPIQEVIRARLYVNEDPGAAFAAWATITLYNQTSQRGEEAIWRSEAMLVYTELSTATTGTNANVIVDDESDFAPDCLVYFIDGINSEFIRLKTIASTCIAEDNPLAHAINVGVSRVCEFSGFSLWDDESGTSSYVKVEFAASQTVSLYLDLEMRT